MQIYFVEKKNISRQGISCTAGFVVNKQHPDRVNMYENMNLGDYTAHIIFPQHSVSRFRRLVYFTNPEDFKLFLSKSTAAAAAALGFGCCEAFEMLAG